MRVRKSPIAGSWYPGNPKRLEETVRNFLAKAEKVVEEPRILVAPHAGYMYSGSVAGFAYKQIDGMMLESVLVLGPSHHYPLRGAAVPESYTHFETPLGLVRISDLAHDLARASRVVKQLDAPHVPEHSIEIQLPFLQVLLRDFEFVPLIVGDTTDAERKELAKVIFEHFDEDSLLVLSTDLSHYHNYSTALELDRESIDAILSLDTRRLLSCELCGLHPVAVGIEVAKLEGLEGKLMKYMNSGDVTGDRGHVVGYPSIAFSRPRLNEEERRFLLSLARRAIEGELKKEELPEPEVESEKLKVKRAVFVTLTKHGELRGCIGHLRAVQPLYKDVIENAVNAAFRDPRFPPLREDELKDVEIEVSILSEPKLIRAKGPEDLLKKIKPRKDGLILECQGRSATYLPQVWELLPEKEEFLESLCEKAFLPKGSWKKKGAKLYRYRVEVVKE